MTPAAPPIELIGYSFQYRTQSEPTLRDIDLRIEAGQKVAIVGASGSGKSTLIHALNGLIPHRYTGIATGTIRVAGADPAQVGLVETARHVGTELQEPGQMLSRPLIAEEIALGMRARGWDEHRIAERTAEMLDVCGLAPFRSWPISALSHGQKKRVSIACVLALDPDVLILDEPTAGQDFAHYTEFMDFLHRINARGTTVLLITHDMHLALEYTDRVLVMSDGRLIADDDPTRVLTDQDVCDRADLVTTGLHTLAQRCGIADAHALVRRFVEVDRAERARRRTEKAQRRADAASAEAPGTSTGEEER